MKCKGKHKTIKEICKCKECDKFINDYIAQMTPEQKKIAKEMGYEIE